MLGKWDLAQLTAALYAASSLVEEAFIVPAIEEGMLAIVPDKV
jgi:hypothetical protein